MFPGILVGIQFGQGVFKQHFLRGLGAGLLKQEVEGGQITCLIRQPAGVNAGEQMLFLAGVGEFVNLVEEDANLVGILQPLRQQLVNLLPVGEQKDLHGNAVVLMGELEGFAGEVRLAPFDFGDFTDVRVDLVRVMQIQLAQTDHDGDQNGKNSNQPEM